MTSTLPASSRNCRGSRPRAAAQQRPSGRSHSTRTDPSTITSPTHQVADPDKPGHPRSQPASHRTQPLPPQRLTRAPVQISSTRAPRHRRGRVCPAQRSPSTTRTAPTTRGAAPSAVEPALGRGTRAGSRRLPGLHPAPARRAVARRLGGDRWLDGSAGALCDRPAAQNDQPLRSSHVTRRGRSGLRRKRV